MEGIGWVWFSLRPMEELRKMNRRMMFGIAYVAIDCCFVPQPPGKLQCQVLFNGRWCELL